MNFREGQIVSPQGKEGDRLLPAADRRRRGGVDPWLVWRQREKMHTTSTRENSITKLGGGATLVGKMRAVVDFRMKIM
jgi:hypothetical protein